MSVCFSPGEPTVCYSKYAIYYINGICNPEKEKIEKEVIPLIQKICSDVTSDIEVKLLHNNTTQDLQTLVNQVMTNKLEEAKDLLAVAIASKISEYLNTASNSVIIIGHSQGVSIMDKVFGSLTEEHLERIHAISIGGTHFVQNSDKVCEFVHRMDWPGQIAQIYDKSKARKPYFQIDGKCTNCTCHDSHTYLNDRDVQMKIQEALKAIIKVFSS